MLRHVRVKRQIIAKQQKENKTMKDISLKHNLHIMEECALKMPIAIGMEKNSPLKPRVDNLVHFIFINNYHKIINYILIMKILLMLMFFI